MQARWFMVMGVAALALQGCKEPPPVLAPPVEPADEAGHAAKCQVDPNPVVLNGKDAVDVKLSVANDGGWCAVRLAQSKSALLRTPPQHGSVYFRNVRDITRLQYTPAPGYTGPDSFTFQLVPSGAPIRTTVDVTAK